MIIKMAWRNIWRNKMRSLIIILSVSVGLFAGLMVLSIYKGMMEGRIKNVIEAEVGNIQVHHPEFKNDYEPAFTIEQPEKFISFLKNQSDISAYTTRSITQGMLATTTGSSGIQINGIIYKEECMVSGLNKKLITGTGLDTKNDLEIIIGKKLADKMKLKKGNKLVLMFTDKSANLVSGAFRVAGVYQSDNAPLDERNVYVQQKTLNNMLDIGAGFHEIVILLHKNENTADFKNMLQNQFSNYKVETWMEISPETALLVNTVDVLSYIVIAIILFALAFGIVNTMLMAILERTREIGMMLALGFNKRKTFFLVLTETVLLTLAGSPIGLITSWGLTFYLHQHGMDWSGMGKEMMSSFGFNTMIYPSFPSEKILSILSFVVGTAILSCIYPALKAMQLQPVDALRK